MKSKMSFYNPGIIRQDFKQHGWIGLLFLIGLLFALPLQLLMISSYENVHYYHTVENHFLINVEIQTVVLIGASIIAGIFLFRYLMIKDATDTLHSLPVRRAHLYSNHLISGSLLLILPIWITAVVTAIVQGMVPYEHQLTIGILFEWAGMMSFMSLFFFFFSVLVGMMTGMSVAQGILALIFLFLPTGLMVLVTYQLSQFLYGFSNAYFNGAQIENWSPIIRFIRIGNDPYTYMEIMIYALMAFLFLILGYVFYRFRQLEDATQPITFQFLRPIFRYGVAFCVMLVSGTYFASVQNHETAWIIFGYIIGGVFGYLIAEMVLHKSWRIFNRKTAKGLVGFAVIITLLVLVIKFDITGFETKVPQAAEVDGVYFGNGIYDIQYREMNNENVYHDDISFIQNVRDLHKQITTRKAKIWEPDRHTRQLAIAYKLKNGRTLVREYTINEQDFQVELKPIVESSQYKMERFQLHQLDQPVDKITIHPSTPVQKRAVITELEEISEFKQLLKEEILELTYEEMNDTRKRWSDIELLFSNDHRGHYALSKSYEKVERWLEEHGYLENTRVTPDDIQYMEIAEVNLKEVNEPIEFILKERFPGSTKIEDLNKIKDALEKYSDPEELYYTQKGITITHIIRFVTKEGSEFYGGLSE